MNLHLNQQVLNITIANSISTTFRNAAEAVKSSGIGLKNVKRRLDLVYPGRHELHIYQDAEHFEVRLQLMLQGLPRSRCTA